MKKILLSRAHQLASYTMLYGVRVVRLNFLMRVKTLYAPSACGTLLIISQTR
jgi:hypothetical protein